MFWEFGTGFQPSFCFSIRYLGRCPGAAPGWFENAPLALTEIGPFWRSKLSVLTHI